MTISQLDSMPAEDIDLDLLFIVENLFAYSLKPSS